MGNTLGIVLGTEEVLGKDLLCHFGAEEKDAGAVASEGSRPPSCCSPNTRACFQASFSFGGCALFSLVLMGCITESQM